MSSQNEAHFQGFPELTDDAPPTPDGCVDAPTTTRRDKDTRMVSLYLSFRGGSCMPILGSCVSVGVALVARLPSRLHLTRNCALTMKGLLTNANVPPEHFENNGAILEVADVFVPLLKQPLDYLKVPLYPNIILLLRHNPGHLTIRQARPA
jgi:hypothetical protein